MKSKIAVIMSRFPHLPETFILREMDELERQGWQIALYPLITQRQPVVHQEAERWIPRAQRLPFISGSIIQDNAAAMFRAPLTYGATLARTWHENLSDTNLLARALVLWPQAVHAARRMERQGIEHIHAHYATHPALAAWIIHRLTGIPYSVSVHAHDIFVRTAMLGTKLRDAAFIRCISNYNRDYLIDHLGEWVRPRARVIHCGIDLKRYPPRPAAQRRPLQILHIGSLQPYKGQTYLIEACALLHERGIPFHCRVVGGGELQSPLHRQIAGLHLESEVELTGPLPQEEVAQLLPAADCYVQPSVITPSGKMEGIPVALMEALATELPVVATSISGVPELVQHGETGLLVPPADPAALADAIARLEANPAEAERLGLAGRERVQQEFNLEANIRQLGEQIDLALGQTRRAAVDSSHSPFATSGSLRQGLRSHKGQ